MAEQRGESGLGQRRRRAVERNEGPEAGAMLEGEVLAGEVEAGGVVPGDLDGEGAGGADAGQACEARDVGGVERELERGQSGLGKIAGAEEADEAGAALVEGAPGAGHGVFGEGAGGKAFGEAAHVVVAEGHGMGADELDGEVVEAGVVADEKDAADGFGDGLDAREEGGGGGEIEAVHGFDEGGFGPGLKRLEGLQGALGGADEHEIGCEAEAGHRGAHG